MGNTQKGSNMNEEIVKKEIREHGYSPREGNIDNFKVLAVKISKPNNTNTKNYTVTYLTGLNLNGRKILYKEIYHEATIRKSNACHTITLPFIGEDVVVSYNKETRFFTR